MFNKKRLRKLALTATILATGFLPGSCALQLRDAALGGTTNFISSTISSTLTNLVNVDQFFANNN